MTTRPTSTVSWGGTAIEPSGGAKSAGFVPGDQPPAQWFNYFLQNFGSWVDYLDEQQAAQRRAMDALLDWTSLTTGVSEVINSVAMDPDTGRCVAVGDNGTILFSQNMGLTWAAETPGSAFAGDIYDVIWSSTLSLWILVGEDEEIQTAPSVATTWTQRHTGGTAELRLLAEGGGQVVTIGDSSVCYRSTNGTTWSAGGAHGVSGTATGLVYDSNSSKFVAVGDNNVAAKFSTSSTGGTWTAGSNPTGVSDFRYESLIFDATAGLLAEGREASSATSPRRIYRSTDASSWTLVLSHDPDDSRALVGTGAGFVSLPEDVMRAGAYSRDGITWSTDYYSVGNLQRASARGLRVFGQGLTRIAFSTGGVGEIFRSRAWVLGV
jgi:hypothetical protein